jgi:hypothetical protein
MSKLKMQRCESCGAPLKAVGDCEYCGTSYAKVEPVNHKGVRQPIYYDRSVFGDKPDFNQQTMLAQLQNGSLSHAIALSPQPRSAWNSFLSGVVQGATGLW